MSLVFSEIFVFIRLQIKIEGTEYELGGIGEEKTVDVIMHGSL
jgi:hypothetical protein